MNDFPHLRRSLAWLTLLSVAPIAFVCGRAVQALLRESHVLDALCALVRFPFEDTPLEFSQLTAALAATSVIKLAYGLINHAVQVCSCLLQISQVRDGILIGTTLLYLQ